MADVPLDPKSDPEIAAILWAMRDGFRGNLGFTDKLGLPVAERVRAALDACRLQAEHDKFDADAEALEAAIDSRLVVLAPEPPLDPELEAAAIMLYKSNGGEGDWDDLPDNAPPNYDQKYTYRVDAATVRDVVDAYRAEQEAVWVEGVRAIADAESNSILEGYAVVVEPDWENATSYSDLATGTITPTDATPPPPFDTAWGRGWVAGRSNALDQRTQVGWYSPKTKRLHTMSNGRVLAGLDAVQAKQYGAVAVFIESAGPPRTTETVAPSGLGSSPKSQAER